MDISGPSEMRRARERSASTAEAAKGFQLRAFGGFGGARTVGGCVGSLAALAGRFMALAVAKR